MKSFIRFLLSGFGTDTNFGKAVGIAILLLLSGILILWYIIRTIWRLIKKNKTPQIPTNPQS